MGQARRRRLAEYDNANEHMAALTAMGAVSHHDNVDEIAELKQRTHDMVLVGSGIARRSGVTWLVLNADRGIAFIEDPADRPFKAWDSPGMDDYYKELVAFLRENEHGVLVVASVMCDTRVTAAGMS